MGGVTPRPEEGRRSFPPRENCRGIGGLYLFRIPSVIKPHQHVVTIVRRATHRVAHDDHAVADINRIQYRCQHTNIGLRSRDNQRVRLALVQMLDQPRFGEGRIACFVNDGRRRAKRRSGGINSNNRRSRHSRVAKRHRT